MHRRPLTAKEWLVISLAAEGLKNRDIAERIGSTEHMVKNYMRSIYDKLGMWNRTELALWYVKRTFEKEHEQRFRPE